MKNKLVVFEGIDGVGKTTVCAALKNELKKKGINVVLYEDLEKSFSDFGILKPFIKKTVRPLSVDASFYFYLSSVLYKSAVIKKLLKKTWVICDRYIYSTVADHIVGGLSRSIVKKLDIFPFLRPDFSFLITVNDKIRLTRVKSRKTNTKQDLIPVKRGSRAYEMEKEYKKMGLVVIKNNGDITSTLSSVLENIFQK